MFALVFLPLPDLNQTNVLRTYEVQYIPFMFVADIIRESPMVITRPETYLVALEDKAILQVVFTFILSLVIEITQLTGFFFIYDGSYRLCDIDDLMTNTLGGFIGAVVIQHLHGMLPEIKHFDREYHRVQVAI